MRSKREGDHEDRPIREAESFMPRKPLDGMRRRAMLAGERELMADRAGRERHDRAERGERPIGHQRSDGTRSWLAGHRSGAVGMTPAASLV
jgi:hypothetical protein